MLTLPLRILPWWGNLALLGFLAWRYQSYLIIAGTIIAFHPAPAPPIFMAEPTSVAEARLQDLRHFRHVGLNERSFTEESRAAFDAVVAELTASVETLNDAEFSLGLARAQATINNGHSNTSLPNLVQSFPRLPIRSSWFGPELRILRALPGFEDLLGARITHINGIEADEVAEAFRSAYGGTDAHFQTLNPLLLETPALLAAIGLAESETEVRLRVAPLSGRSTTRVLSPVTAQPETRHIYPGELQLPWMNESANWISFTPNPRRGEVPHFLRHPEAGYWMELIPEMDAAYISLRTNVDDDSLEETLLEFTTRVIAELTEASPRTIIFDQRFNSGGDFTRTAELMSSLEVLAHEGRVYLLTSGTTFSAAIVNLAFAEQSAPDRVFIVGEPVGDKLQFWAEGWGYRLPNSGLIARFSTGFYDLQNGCEGLFQCHWGSRHLMPVLVDDLDVDIAAPMNFEDYAAGRDPAMRSISWGEMARQWD